MSDIEDNLPETKDESGFFYIIQTPDVPPSVYKIGKTVRPNPNKRLCAYPKFSIVKYTIAVANADLFEDIIMRKFKTAFKRRMELGLEYYEGDLVDMICVVHSLWLKYGQQASLSIDRSLEKIKPNGWQSFVNEWLVKNPDAQPDVAYTAYVDMMQNTFLSNEYAEYPAFALYFEKTTNV
jgi:hypothetical protein